MPRNHTLYRFYATDGTLLYIGITANPTARLRAHSRTKTWWTQIGNVTLQHLPTRAALIEAERNAIHTERPLHNVVHNRHPTSGAPPTPTEVDSRTPSRWHHLIGQIDAIKERTSWGCAEIWHHVQQRDYTAARERLDALLADMAWAGSAAAQDILAQQFHSGGEGPCLCSQRAMYFRESDRYIHVDGSPSCLQSTLPNNAYYDTNGYSGVLQLKEYT